MMYTHVFLWHSNADLKTGIHSKPNKNDGCKLTGHNVVFTVLQRTWINTKINEEEMEVKRNSLFFRWSTFLIENFG